MERSREYKSGSDGFLQDSRIFPSVENNAAAFASLRPPQPRRWTSMKTTFQYLSLSFSPPLPLPRAFVCLSVLCLGPDVSGNFATIGRPSFRICLICFFFFFRSFWYAFFNFFSFRSWIREIRISRLSCRSSIEQNEAIPSSIFISPLSSTTRICRGNRGKSIISQILTRQAFDSHFLLSQFSSHRGKEREKKQTVISLLSLSLIPRLVTRSIVPTTRPVTTHASTRPRRKLSQRRRKSAIRVLS